MDKQEFPEDLKYTSEHEWVREPGDVEGASGSASRTTHRTHWATSCTSACPRSVPRCQAGDACGELESTKSVSDLYAPITGTVVARNEALDEHPELINCRPLR